MNRRLRWFFGLDWDDKMFDHSTLSLRRGGLFGNGAPEAVFCAAVRMIHVRNLIQCDRMVADGTLIRRGPATNFPS